MKHLYRSIFFLVLVFPFSFRSIKVLALVLFAGFFFSSSFAQVNPCTPNTPSYIVDLTSNPGGTWVSSPPIVRDGSCCGSQWPDRCIVFLITLDSSTVAINFNIASGAVPPGAMFYQIDCGPPTPVGQPICLQGPGPYALTFCKPGANLNTYAITAIAAPSGPPNDTVGVGCSIPLSVNGLSPSSITWTSIFPGSAGAFNNYLSCTSGCTTTVVTPLAGAPGFVDYKVCGQSLAPSCLPDPNFCDTVRVYFNPALAANVTPDPPAYCISAGGITLTGNVSGGDGTYFFQWTNQGGTVIGTDSSYFASAPGTYIFQVFDGQYPGCPAKYDTVVVTQQNAPGVSAGPDQTICSGGSIALSGTMSGGTGVLWSGGNGFFNPNNSSMNITYTPSTAEIAAGTATLTLSSTGNGACPPATDQVTIFIKPPLTTAIAGSSIVCFGASTQLTANVSGGTAPYSYSWSTGATSQSIIASPGNYSVTVTDMSSGTCTSVATFSVLQDPQVSVTVSPNSSINCSVTTAVSATPSGGNGSFTYLWNTGQTSQTVIVYPGIYSVTVTDGVGCTASGTVNVAGINSTLSASISSPSNLCFGGTKNITVVASGGFGGYNYQWNTGQTVQTVNVSAGTYCCTVTDAGGCITTACVTVNQNSPLSVAITNPSPVCNGAMDTVTAVPNGGQSPYTYLWSSGQTSQSIIQGAGTYSVTVTDANQNGGCTASSSAVVFNEPNFTISLNSNNVSCFGGNNGNATVSASGGVPGYTYQWSPSGGTTTTASNLGAGNYTVAVTDNIGCTQTGTVTITEPLVLFSSISVNSNVNCNGGSNGIATVSVSGGSTPYSFQWTPYGGTGATATGLIAGTYMVTITDAKGCSNSASTTITQPSVLSATISSTNVSCNSGNNGSAMVIASGGSAPYSYSWSNGGITAAVSNLTPGNYSVTITDDKNCTVVKTVAISQPSALNAGISSSSNVSCNGAGDGEAAAMASGGTTPYTYSWSTGISAQAISGLSPGNYSVTATDASGCTSAASVTITQPGVLIASASPDQGIACNNTVTLTSTPIGGTTAYSYQWSNGAVTSSIISNTPGVYVVTVTDANNCVAVDSVIVTATNSSLNTTVNAPAIICNGSSVLITASPSGGAGNYSFQWSTGQTNSSITVNTGIYCVTVTDNNGCQFTACANIQEEPAFSAAVTPTAACFGSPQTLTAIPSGGIAPYSFLWGTGETTQSVIKNAGTYSVTITDSIACTAVVTVNVTESPLLQMGFSDVHNITCKGDDDGSATASPDGGTPGYTYQWSPVSSVNSSVYNLSPGTYSVTVTDAVGCTDTGSVTITEPSAILAVDSIDGSNISCYGGSDGFATVAVSGGNFPYSYLWWYDGDTVASNTTLPAGYYSVSVADTGGCTAIETVYLSQPPKLNLLAGVVAHVSCNGGANGSATTQVSGGKTPYTYQWSNGGSSATLTALSAGSYYVTVTDANGCTVQSSAVQIAQPSAITVVPTVSNAVCTSPTGSVIVNVYGGSAPYSFNWSTGDTNAIVTGVVSGTYNITVTDNSGCIQSQAITVGASQPNITITSSITSAICSSSTGSAALNTTGGTAPYAYLWSNGGTSASLSGIAAGTYSVTVTDSTGCAKTQPVTISSTPSTVSLSSVIQAVSCNGGTDGSIYVNATGGAPPYTYTWITPPSSGQTIDSLPAGNYTISVTDTNTCSKDSTFNIQQPSPLGILSNSSDVSCIGDTNGTISLTMMGGNTPYSFLWSTGAVSQNISSLPKGIYSVTVTDSKGCSSSITDTIYEPQQALAAEVDTSTNAACYGGSNGAAAASATGGTVPYSYAWSTGDQVQWADSLSKGYYFVTVTDAGGCTSVDSIFISEPGEIEVAIAGSDTICSGKAVVLTAAASGGNGNFSYTWIGLGTGASQLVSPAEDTTFTVIAIDALGCGDTSKINITVNPPITPSILVTDSAICSGETVTIAAVATGGMGSDYTYSWSPAIGTGPGPFSVSPVATSTYLVWVSDDCSDSSLATITITVNPVPAATLNAVPLDGCAPITISFNSNTQGNPPGTTYLWDFGDGGTSSFTNTTHTYTDSGTYLVGLTATSDGCSATFYILSEINIYPQPTAHFAATPQPTTLAFPNITFTNNSSGATGYWWDFGDGSISTEQEPVFNHGYKDTGTYEVTLIVTNEYGCTDTFTLEIVVLPEFQFWIPSAFTPEDKNGKNDFFTGKGICINDYEMYIFDRWGDEIYHTTDLNKPWDGRAHEGKKQVQIGVYVYLVYVWDCLGERHRYIGHVTVVR